MIKEILKKTGSIVLIFAALTGTLSAKEEVIDTVLSPRRVSTGDRATLTLKIPKGDGDIRPVKVPAVKGLHIDYSGAQHSFQYINGKTWRGVSLTFTVTALKRGTYRIPSFILQRGADRLRSKPVTMTVVKGDPGSRAAGGSPSVIRAVVELDKKEVHAGEPVLMRYYLVSAGGGDIGVRGMSRQPESKGCIINEIEEHREDKIITTDEGEMVKSHLVTFAVVPAAEGTLKIGGGTVVITVEKSRGFFGFTGQEQVAFDMVPLKVSALPAAGRPADFSGNVGSYTLKVDVDRSPVKVYDERRITVTVSGAGNIAAMTRPELGSEVKDIRILAEDGESKLRLTERGLEGEKIFYYTVIPEKSGEINLGSVTLNFYDSTSSAYREISSEKILLTVTGDSGKNSRIDFDEEEEGKPSFNIALIVFIVLLVSGAIVFMVLWERKRFKIISSDEQKETEHEEEEAVGGEDAREALLSALDSRDSDLFFKAADRILKISIVDDSVDSALLEDVRNRLYGIRFGGGSLDGEAMDDIYGLLKEAGALKG